MAAGVYLSLDGGVNWRETLVLNSKVAFSFAEAPDGTLYLISGDWSSSQTGSVQVSMDSGRTWTDQLTPIDLDAWTLAVDSCDSKRLYLADEQYWAWKNGWPDNISKIHVSTDGGKSWQTNQSHPAPFYSGSLTNSSKAIYAGTVQEASQGVYRTTDQGMTWKSTGGPSVHEDSRNLIAINNNTVFAIDPNGSIWATFNSGGDSVSSFAISPASLFNSDTIQCDSLAAGVLSFPDCSGLSISTSKLGGADTSSYQIESTSGNSILVAFRPLSPGKHQAFVIGALTDGTFDTILLNGMSVGKHELTLSTVDQTTDTIGNTISVPITINGLKQPENVNLVLHYDPILQYQGSFDAANVKLDIPNEWWPGRSELNIPQAQSNVIAGYARFTIFADSIAKPQVTFDSLDVLSAVSPCEYTLPAPATSIITPPSGCGSTILSQFIEDSARLILSIRPNPTMGSVELNSSLDLGNTEVEIYDVLGVKRADLWVTLSKEAPAQFSLPDGAGIYYVRVNSIAGVRSMSVVVAK